jgi:hypothetical protein
MNKGIPDLKLVTTIVAAGLLLGCQQLTVTTQFDPYVDFDRYSSYDWLPEDDQKESADGQQLLRRQLKYVVERELKAKGYTKESSQLGFLISYYGSEEKKSSERMVEHTNYWGDRNRYDYYRHGQIDYNDKWKYPPNQLGGSGTYTRRVETQTISYTEGTLVLDFFDGDTKELVWQATINGVLDESDPMKCLEKAVKDALAAFPPGGGE